MVEFKKKAEKMKEALRGLLPEKLVRFSSKYFDSFKNLERPLYVSYSGGSNSVLQCCVAYNKYGGYCIPMNSRRRPAAQKVFRGEVYERETIEYIEENAAKGDIVHAGTFFGDFLPALSRACSDGATLWAFEPNPESFRCAQITSLINGLENIVLRNAGLGADKGMYPMMIVDENGRSLGGASRFVEAPEEGTKNNIFVDITTVDDVVPSERKVSVLQLDVEGFEKMALIGAMSTIERNRPIIIIESVPEKEWFSKQVLKLGYHFEKELCGNKVFVSKVSKK